jgi:hypothetical protein
MKGFVGFVGVVGLIAAGVVEAVNNFTNPGYVPFIRKLSVDPVETVSFKLEEVPSPFNMTNFIGVTTYSYEKDCVD